MSSSLTSPRPPWAAFTAWLVVGALYGLAGVGILSIGLFVLPVAVLATLFLARSRRAIPGRPGLAAGLGLAPLYVAFLNRHGPGTSCTTTAVSQSCIQNLDPWSWLAAGLVLIAVGTFVFVHRPADRPRLTPHQG